MLVFPFYLSLLCHVRHLLIFVHGCYEVVHNPARSLNRIGKVRATCCQLPWRPSCTGEMHAPHVAFLGVSLLNILLRVYLMVVWEGSYSFFFPFIYF